MSQHIQIVMRQFVTQYVSAVLGTQNTDPYRRGGDDFTVELLMLFQTLGVVFRRNKYPPFIHARQREQDRASQDIQHDSVEDQHPDTLEHLIDGNRIDNTQR